MLREKYVVGEMLERKVPREGCWSGERERERKRERARDSGQDTKKKTAEERTTGGKKC